MLAFPHLKTKRLLLRQATQEDTEAIFAVFCDPQVTQFHNLETFTAVDEAIEVIERRVKAFESGYGIRWGIARQQDNRLIGSCGFTWDRNANAAEVGYELASQFWRQGIMSEALRALLQYGFEVIELEYVIAQVMLANVASKKLLQKLGFQSQGILQQHRFWKGQYHNLEQFVLTKAEFVAV